MINGCTAIQSLSLWKREKPTRKKWQRGYDSFRGKPAHIIETDFYEVVYSVFCNLQCLTAWHEVHEEIIECPFMTSLGNIIPVSPTES